MVVPDGSAVVDAPPEWAAPFVPEGSAVGDIVLPEPFDPVDVATVGGLVVDTVDDPDGAAVAVAVDGVLFCAVSVGVAEVGIVPVRAVDPVLGLPGLWVSISGSFGRLAWKPESTSVAWSSGARMDVGNSTVARVPP